MTSHQHAPPIALSKIVSHALRHEPWTYELELDEEGWVSVDQVVSAIRRRGGPWADVDRLQIEEMMRDADKKRHELQGDRMRALYGHSLPGRLARERASPPAVLFHGTAPDLTREIFALGLLPMGRQYVHLSVDETTAWAVGRRKHKTPVILRIAATQADAQGVAFYRGNDRVWLADSIPAQFISVNASSHRE